MEQVFRIEIPVEVVNKTDTASLNKLESAIQKIFQTAAKGGQAANGFKAIQQAAEQATQSMNQAAQSANNTSQALDQASESADFDQAAQSAEQASQSVEEMGEAAQEAAQQLEEVGDAAQQAGQGAEGAFDGAGSNVDKFSQRVNKSSAQLRKMFAEKFKLTIAALDKASPAIKKITGSVKSLVGKAWNITVRMADFVTKPFRGLVKMITSPVTMALSLTGVGMGAADFLTTFESFESGMSNVKAISGATNEQFIQLTDTAKELGETTKFSATEASEGMQYLAMAGWKTEDIIAAMPGLLDLAAAGGTDLGTASDIVSDVMTAMGMSAEEATRAADVFAKTASSSNTTIEGLGQTMKYAAPVAHSFGMSLEDVSAAAGLMANSGIKGEQAGTALRSTLLRMSAPTSDMQKTMKKLGISFTDSGGKMKTMSDIIKQLTTSFSTLSDSEKLSAAQSLFGTEGASAWLGVISQGSEAYDKMAQSLYGASGAAEEMAGTQMDNLTGDIQLLQSAAEGMKISLMEQLDPYLRKGVQWLTSKIPDITEGASGLIDGIIEKATGIKDKFSEVFDSAEFQNADGFGEKLQIAWDKIIAEPFSEWWSGGGQQKILDSLAKLGEGAGDVLHGVFTGLIGGIFGKGEGENMDATGIGAAAAQMAKQFISSFIENLDFGDIIDRLPKLLTGALAGFGGFKAVKAVGETVSDVSEGVGEVSDIFSSLSDALGGVNDAIDTVSGAAENVTGILGGLKSVVGMVPGWGWAAAGAIAAVGGAIYLYNKHVEEEKERLWELGDACIEAQEEFQSTAEEVNKTVSDLDTLTGERNTLEYKIWVHRTGLSESQITGIKDRLTEIDGEEAELTVKILEGDSGLTKDELDSTISTLTEINGQKYTVTASILGGTLTEEDQKLYDLIKEYNLAKFDPDLQARVYSNIIALCDSPEKAEQVKQLLTEFNNEDLDPVTWATVTAGIISTISGNTMPETVLGLLQKYAEMGEIPDDVTLEADLITACKAAGMDDTAARDFAMTNLPLFKEFGSLMSNEATIKANLDASGVKPEDMALIDELVALETEKHTLLLTLEGGLMDEEEYEATKQRINDIDDEIYDLTQGAVDLHGQQGAAVEALTAQYEDQLETLKEINRMNMVRNVDAVKENLPEIKEQEQESKEKEAEIQKQIDELNKTPEQALAVMESSKALEDQRLSNLDTMSKDDYYAYMLEDYVPQAEQVFRSASEVVGNSQQDTDEMWGSISSELLGNLAETYGKGGDISGFNLDTYAVDTFTWVTDATNANAEEIEDLKGDLAAQQAETQKSANARLAYFQGTESVMTTEYFKGTEFEGKSLAEIAPRFNEFAHIPSMVQAFTSAVTDYDALVQQQLQEGNLNEGEYATVDELLAMKEASMVNYTPPTPTPTPESGGKTYGSTPEQALSSLTTQNTMEGVDTKFTRDLKANREAYEEAVKNGDEAKQAEILADRGAIITGQTNAIQTGIEGVEQYDISIAAKNKEIQEKQGEIDSKDYTGTLTALKEAQNQYEGVYSAGFGGETGEDAKNAFNASTEGRNVLDGINQQLDSLGVEKIDNLNQLGDAIERVNSQQTTDQTALTTLNQELAGLEEGRVQLLQETTNALDSLTWNINEINGEQGIDENLKISEDTVTNANNLYINLGNVAQSASTTKKPLNNAAEAAQLVRDKTKEAAEKVNDLRSKLDGLVGNYTVTVDYIFNVPPTPNVPGEKTGEDGNGNTSPDKKAAGGIIDRPLLTWVAEAGPEAIIPLGSARRDRGLQLWEEAGAALGVMDEYSPSGLSAPMCNAFSQLPDDFWNEDGEPSAPALSGVGSGSPIVVEVNVSANPEYHIDGDAGDVFEQLRGRQQELGEIVAVSIADQLEDYLSNMPD